MHPACMHACKCMYIHPPTHTSTSIIQLNRYTQKYINLWLWPKRPPLAFHMAEMSVAEMSWPKCPWPKRPWPKYPTFVLPRIERQDLPLSKTCSCVGSSEPSNRILGEGKRRATKRVRALKPCSCAQFAPGCKFAPGGKFTPGCKFAPPYVAFIC